jgi:serpin B
MTKKKLWVDKAIHSANIDFSEEGVKAAAVTAFMMMDSAMVRENEPVKVEIDKPFLYFIKDKKSGEIWFVGTLYEPNNWENDQKEYRN